MIEFLQILGQKLMQQKEILAWVDKMFYVTLKVMFAWLSMGFLTYIAYDNINKSVPEKYKVYCYATVDSIAITITYIITVYYFISFF